LAFPRILSFRNLLFLASPRLASQKLSARKDVRCRGDTPVATYTAREGKGYETERRRDSNDKDDESFLKRLAVCGKKLYCKIESKQREKFSLCCHEIPNLAIKDNFAPQ
jgi:hypothetical protein